MSKKFFTLIHGENVHAAPGTKIIEGDAFSKLMTIEETLEAVKKDGDQYRISVAKECEQIKQEAYKEGFEQGLSAWAEQILLLKNEIASTQEEVTKVIIPLALKAAKKIVGREIEINKDIILDIVKNNLRAVSQHKTVNIYVNKKDLLTLEKNRASLKKLLESAEVLNFRERSDIAPGGCIIETEVGIINAQLDNQWLLLEQAFESLMKVKQT